MQVDLQRTWQPEHSRTLRNRFLSEIKSEIKYPTNIVNVLYFISCSKPICPVIRILIQSEKRYQ